MLEESAAPRGGALVRLVPWTVLALTLGISGGALVLLLAGGAEDGTDLLTKLERGLGIGWGPVCCLIGALITSSRRGNLIGWLLVALGLLVSLVLFAVTVAETDHPAADTFNFLGDVLWLLWVSLFALLVLLFPDGRPLSPRWRPVVRFAALWPPTILLLVVVFEPQAVMAERPSGAIADIAVSLLLLATLIGVTVSALIRFARSRGVERQQLKWFAYLTTVGLALAVTGTFIPGWGGVLASVGLFGPLSGIAVALLRHRLYDIDVLIGRTFVYGALVAILAGLYSAAIRLFNALFVGMTGIGSEEALVITTLILAASFTPIKKWLEEIVEQRYKKPADVAAASPGALTDPTAFAAIEGRLRAIVREELERPGRAG